MDRNNDGLFTISQFAALRGVTSETLRYYDRVGLLNPMYTDPNTGYRYYSILQYERLGTIKELRQLGFSVEAIIEYFKKRNISKSIAMLEQKHEEVASHLKKLSHLEKILTQKLEYLHGLKPPAAEMSPRFIELPERHYITMGKMLETDQEGIGYAVLEKSLSELSPVLATNRVGHYLPFSHCEDIGSKCVPFIFDSSGTAPSSYRRTFPAGTYASVYFSNGLALQTHKKYFLSLLDFIQENSAVPASDYVICYFPVDLTITDEEQEFSVEMQIQVKFI